MEVLETLGTSNVPLIAAFFIGIMMAVSPCPLATNITAIAYISRQIDDSRHTLLVGIVYCIGRMITYVLIASLIVYAGLNIQSVSFLLQTYGERLLGPFLVVIGVLMLGIIRVDIGVIGPKLGEYRQHIAERGYIGAFLIGLLFALSFCPFSAVLFFGLLIPLAYKTGDALLIPAVFALATGLPVILAALLITAGVKQVGRFLQRMEYVEFWVKKAVALVFIVTGIYYVSIVYGG
jgi:cytochrome c-type biogenesis protein